MQCKLPLRSRTPVRLSARERRAIKRNTARHLRRAAKRDPETGLGRDTRSRTKGWAD